MSRRLVRRLSLIAIAAVAATVGLTTAGPALAATDGTITGHLTDGGEPIPYVSITLWHANGEDVIQDGGSDGTGAFTFSNVPPGDYKLSFELPGNVKQWYHQTLDSGDADLINV